MFKEIREENIFNALKEMRRYPTIDSIIKCKVYAASEGMGYFLNDFSMYIINKNGHTYFTNYNESQLNYKEIEYRSWPTTYQGHYQFLLLLFGNDILFDLIYGSNGYRSKEEWQICNYPRIMITEEKYNKVSKTFSNRMKKYTECIGAIRNIMNHRVIPKHVLNYEKKIDVYDSLLFLGMFDILKDDPLFNKDKRYIDVINNLEDNKINNIIKQKYAALKNNKLKKISLDYFVQVLEKI